MADEPEQGGPGGTRRGARARGPHHHRCRALAWELREHPLSVPEWSAERLLPQVEAVLDGDADALRAAYLVVERECRAWDERHGGHDLHELIESWGDELGLLRGS